VLEMLEDEEDVREIIKAQQEGDQKYTPLEEVERKWRERHKNR
jgi:hypothetical protein